MSNNVENFILEEGKHLVFTSDLHFFHKKIIDFTGRPTTLENLTSWIITQCNSKIPVEGSTVIHTGDMFFSCTNDQAVEVLSQLNGDWWFILGNHDNEGKLKTVIETVNKLKGTNHRILGWYHRLLVKTPPKVKNEKWNKKLLILCHFPIEDWDSKHYGSAMIHGHVHGGGSGHEGGPLTKLPNRFDVGIDNSHTWSPFTYNELRVILRKTKDYAISNT
jgi:calcineurin-like phosphoesterase family protein